MAKNVYFEASGNHRVKAISIGASGNKKVVKGYIGVNGTNRLFFEDVYGVGYCWLIDASGTKEYNSAGTLVTQNSNSTSWTCPVDGVFSFEIHAYGGPGANGDGDYYNRNGITRAGAAGGTGGSGSGTIIDNVNCPINHVLNIKLGTEFDGTYHSTNVRSADGSNLINLLCNPGSGASSSHVRVTMYDFEVRSYPPGQVGSYFYGRTIASASVQAQTYENENGTTAFASGTVGGSGGATIGNYGDGGRGDDANQNGPIQYSDKPGKPSAVIIRRVS